MQPDYQPQLWEIESALCAEHIITESARLVQSVKARLVHDLNSRLRFCWLALQMCVAFRFVPPLAGHSRVRLRKMPNQEGRLYVARVRQARRGSACRRAVQVPTFPFELPARHVCRPVHTPGCSVRVEILQRAEIPARTSMPQSSMDLVLMDSNLTTLGQ